MIAFFYMVGIPQSGSYNGPEKPASARASQNAGRKSPIPSLEWHLTDVCNYRCEYCCERQFDPSRTHDGMMPDDLVQRVLETTKTLPGTWHAKFASGEPTLHPRFFEAAASLCEQGHQVALTTNFSMNKKKQAELVEKCGDKLDFVTASLHLSQTDADDFVDRVQNFQSIKSPATSLSVNTVMLPEKFDELKQLYEKLTSLGIEMNFQVLKAQDGFQRYPEHIEQYIKDKVIKATNLLRDRNLYGRYCHTGELFFIIKPDGDCLRCYSQRPLWNYLGSIKKGTFCRYEAPRPCLSRYCNCLLPANRGMIEYDQPSTRAARAAHMLRASAKGWRFDLKNRMKN
ncbi:MAG: radical SAM protein [bacterium]